MKLVNLIKVAFSALLRNKGRAFLTMLGIVIGIASVIAMVSIGQSSSQSVSEQLSTMGSNMILIMPGKQMRGGVSMGVSNSKSLTMDDVTELKAKSHYIESVSPSVSSGGQLVYGTNNHPGNVQGVSPVYLTIRKYELKQGVMFNDDDVRVASKVCIVGKTVTDKLFPDGENPLGKMIRFGNVPFRIIGVLEPKGRNQMGQDQDDIVLAPYTTVQKRILAITHINMIFASAKSEEVSESAATEATQIIRENHELTGTTENDFEVRTQEELLSMMNSVTSMLTILLAAIASISLFVGGIGIMNIMYVTVTERTKEIGLRMAIGAKNRDILLQFLFESIILSLLGGVIGIVLGLLLSYSASTMLGWPFIMSEFAVIGSFLVCAATGVFFGWYPAKRAAQLDPITAIRYE
ncbi:MAG: FtsX-like permease family protein [Bacteroidales bacterium]|nr:FtsX-like permease family protein [Bacteroidales bacterium]